MSEVHYTRALARRIAKDGRWWGGRREVAFNGAAISVNPQYVPLYHRFLNRYSRDQCPIQTQSLYISHDSIHEINTWKCPIQTQRGYIGYISHDNIHEINTWKCPIQTQCGYIGYISHDNIHEINTWKCPIQTQCGYIGYISHGNIHEINTWKCPIQTVWLGYMYSSFMLNKVQAVLTWGNDPLKAGHPDGTRGRQHTASTVIKNM